MQTIGIFHTKGGVGKSAVAVPASKRVARWRGCSSRRSTTRSTRRRPRMRSW